MAEISSPLMTKLLNIKDYCDLTLECHGQEFRVHKAIVCAQSPVIAAALRGNFMEAQTGVLNVSFDIESVRRLIEFMYTGDYQVPSNPVLNVLLSGVPDQICTTEEQRKDMEISINTAEPTISVGVLEPSESISDILICHGRMNSIADYYDVPALAALSSSRVEEILANYWSAELFHYLLQQCLGSTSDKIFFRMLGAKAVDHIFELFERHIFDEGGLAERLAPYVLPKCILKLKAADSREKAFASSLLSEQEAGERETRNGAEILDVMLNSPVTLIEKVKAINPPTFCVAPVAVVARIENNRDVEFMRHGTVQFHARHLVCILGIYSSRI
ncbi:hypothetical protein F5Y19DRAFT_470849 [Xylariaceae sp. FL1651]|nr:hypothetical protein F5Y19DRAFT_470849 [Xylariaceae sp. FL1651]